MYQAILSRHSHVSRHDLGCTMSDHKSRWLYQGQPLSPSNDALFSLTCSHVDTAHSQVDTAHSQVDTAHLSQPVANFSTLRVDCRIPFKTYLQNLVESLRRSSKQNTENIHDQSGYKVETARVEQQAGDKTEPHKFALKRNSLESTNISQRGFSDRRYMGEAEAKHSSFMNFTNSRIRSHPASNVPTQFKFYQCANTIPFLLQNTIPETESSVVNSSPVPNTRVPVFHQKSFVRSLPPYFEQHKEHLRLCTQGNVNAPQIRFYHSPQPVPGNYFQPVMPHRTRMPACTGFQPQPKTTSAHVVEKSCKPAPVKRYKCDVCQKAFSRSNTLITHRRHLISRKQRIHTGDKPFSCEVCGRAFRQPGNLTRHRLTHTSYRPFVCHICHKAFNRSSNLSTHVKTHGYLRHIDYSPSK